jgi:hypothetical protein
MILDTIQGVIGTAAPAPHLPGTWVHTGEDCCDAIGDDGNPDGMNVFYVSNFSKVNIDFGIQDPQATGLPVTVKNFYAMEFKCGSLLSWTTSQEENSSHVDIYRKDGQYGYFHKIARVQSAVSSDEEKAYSYLDKDVSQDGEYQYQLKFVDIDNKYTLSNIKTVKLDCTKEHIGMNVFPNPASGKLNILYITEEDRVALKLEVIDVSGRKIMSHSQYVHGGGTLITLDISALANGTYFLRYDDIDGHVKGSEKFVKH